MEKETMSEKRHDHNMPHSASSHYIRPRWPENAGNFTGERDLVRPSAGCLSMGIYEVEIHPDS